MVDKMDRCTVDLSNRDGSTMIVIERYVEFNPRLASHGSIVRATSWDISPLITVCMCSRVTNVITA